MNKIRRDIMEAILVYALEPPDGDEFKSEKSMELYYEGFRDACIGILEAIADLEKEAR